MRRSAIAAYLFLTIAFIHSSGHAQTGTSARVPENFYSAMQWRCIGPHRGGRVLAVSGVRDEPGTFYFGAVAGGVWKTTDAGHTWTPIFDRQPAFPSQSLSSSCPKLLAA